MGFTKATKEQTKLKMVLHGPSGSGKTYSALQIGKHLGKLALVDTEFKSASKYANIADFDSQTVSEPYHPDRVGKLIKEAADAGYECLIIDSLTHFWSGTGGFLELVEAKAKEMAARGGKYDSFAAWKHITPLYRKMTDAILAAPIHIIVTLRSKQAHVLEEGDNGKKKVRKVGLEPEMRDQFEYNLDIEGALNMDHQLVIGKTRCSDVDGKVFDKPGKEFAEIVKAWLSDGKVKVDAK